MSPAQTFLSSRPICQTRAPNQPGREGRGARISRHALASNGISHLLRFRLTIQSRGTKIVPILLPLSQALDIGERVLALKDLLAELSDIRSRLQPYGITSEAGYAELLVAKALGGTRHKSGVEAGSDLVAPVFGRVEVRSRTLPLDGRNESRVNLPKSKKGKFDWLAGIIFSPSLEIFASYLIPHDAAWDLASCNKRSDVCLANVLAHPAVKAIPGLTAAEHALNV